MKSSSPTRDLEIILRDKLNRNYQEDINEIKQKSEKEVKYILF